MLEDSKFWVTVSLLMFFGLLIYLRVPRMVTDALDERSRKISAQLEEAKQLRDDAQTLLAEYQRKQREAEEEADKIIAAAEAEAKRYAEESNAAIDAQLKRRQTLAEQRIAQAEARAIAEVRAIAAEVAIDAAQRVLKDKIDSDADAHLIKSGIDDLADRLRA